MVAAVAGVAGAVVNPVGSGGCGGERPCGGWWRRRWQLWWLAVADSGGKRCAATAQAAVVESLAGQWRRKRLMDRGWKWRLWQR